MKLKFSKKAMFILIILMVLISLSTVSAAKTNSSDDMGRFQYDQSELENDLDSTELSDSSDENVLSSAYTFTGATFTELKENISSLNDGDVLDLTNNITQDGNAEITISKSITINGNGVTIDAQGKSRIFNITANNVILKDIIFTNGKTTDDGGAVFFLKDGEVTNCKFTNNTANYGGAVYFKPNSACNITNCNFTGNTATYDGGAVYFWDKCSISNCNFANNTASRDGGAVTSNDGSTGTVTNCTFTNNAASGDGGAVMLYGPFTVTNCNFTNNIASNNGGAVYFMAKSTAENCNFTNNTASNNGGAVYFLDDATVTKCNFTNNLAENGGAIFVFKYSTSTVSNCNFANNTASNNGGALSAFNNMDILNSVFNNNIADKTGGAVYIDDTLSDSKINSTFINNSAYQGGAIFFNGETDNNTISGYFEGNKAERIGGAICFQTKSTGNTISAEFNANHAINASGGAIFYRNVSENNQFESIFTANFGVAGGAIFFYNKSNNNRFNSDFRFNVANSSGGAIVFYGTADGNNFTCSFVNNTALGERPASDMNGNGGAITFSDVSSNCLFTGDFVNNTAGEHGGAVNYKKTPHNITFNGNFINNSAKYGGGINFFESFENITFNGEFIGNSAGNGGAINTYSGTVENCKFVNNTATFYGGAVYIQGNGTVTNSNFTENTALVGGALYLLNENSVTNCNFVNNSAAYNGGAIWMYYGNIENSTFTDNKATNNESYGGAIFIFSGSIENCNFTNNTATYDGGAVYFYSNGTVTNCNFADNTAFEYGGAVYLPYNGTVTKCNFVNNSATFYGGAVYLPYNGTVTKCNFVNNSAAFNGGAVYFQDNGTVTNSNFTENTALVGGALYLLNENSVENCNFVNNSATYTGGAIWMYYSNVENCTFTDNKATNNESYGGAVCIVSGSIENSNFTNNTASNNGGAVYFYSNGTVTNCNFADNTAFEYGGAVYFPDNGTVTNCNFANNTAFEYGGAVCFSNNGTVTNCNFTNNTALVGGALYLLNESSVTNCNFTGNNAINASAIYFYSASATKTVSNSLFLNNRAKAESLEVTKNENNITITFIGNDNLLNAIYSTGDVTFTNVTYWGANGIANTGSSSTTPARSNKAAGQNITVGVVVNDEHVLNEVKVTDENGTIVLNISAGENYYIIARHDTDSYYTEAETTMSNNTKFNVNVTSQTTTNKTVNMTAKSNIPQDIVQGKLLFTLPNGTEIDANYANNGTWWAVHTFDDYSEYEVNASYRGLDNVTINNGTINITRANSTITLDNITLNYGENKNVTVETEGATSITAKIDNEEISVDNFTIPISDLSVGNHTLTVTTEADEDHNSVTEEFKITVNKASSEIILSNTTFDLKIGDAVDSGATLTPAGAGNLTYTSSDENIVKIADGKIIAVGAGNATITVSFAGNDNYTQAEDAAVSVTVSKFNTAIDVNITPDGNKVAITAAVDNSSASGLVKFEIRGTENYTFYLDIENGKATINLKLDAGNYTINATYLGDDYFNENATAISFTADDTEKTATEFTDIVINDKVVTLTLRDAAGNAVSGANISYTINGTVKTAQTGSDGSVSIESDYGVVISIDYAGDDTYLATNTSIKFDNAAPYRVATKFNVTNGYNLKVYAVDYKAGERGAMFDVLLTDTNGNPLVNQSVVFAINGWVHNKTTDTNGVAHLQINLQDANKYTCAPCYLGNTTYDATFASAMLTVVKKPITISAAAKSYKSTAKTKKYTVTLKTIKGSSANGKTYLSSGKKVTLKINGKTYTAKTNAKGQATFSIKLTKKGKFQTLIKFAGDNTYEAASKKVTITIK